MTSYNSKLFLQLLDLASVDVKIIKLMRVLGIIVPVAFLAASCASVPVTKSGALSSYKNISAESSKVSKNHFYVGSSVKSAVTARIVSASVSDSVKEVIPKQSEQVLLSNALDRSLCVALSDSYRIVAADEPADLTFHSIITSVIPTNKVLAGASTALSLGTSLVLPVSVPRLPIGLGGLAVEGEALDPKGEQVVAILWAKGANAITTKARISEIGDAYVLSAAYGNDFASIASTQKAPSSFHFSLPSQQRIKSLLGGKPKYAACDIYGRSAGISGAVTGVIGGPPEWTDKVGSDAVTK